MLMALLGRLPVENRHLCFVQMACIMLVTLANVKVDRGRWRPIRKTKISERTLVQVESCLVFSKAQQINI